MTGFKKMRVFWVFAWGMIGYLWIIVIGVINPQMFNAVITDPINTYRLFIDQNFKPIVAVDPFQLTEVNDDNHKGVIALNESKSYKGYTFLISNANDISTELIDMNGKTVHKWYVPVEEIQKYLPRIDHKIDRPLTQTTRAFFDPTDGSVTLIYQIRKNPYVMLGTLKIDKDSNILWAYDDRTHHDIEFNEDGSLYVLTKRDHFERLDTNLGIEAPVWDELIIHLDKNGQKIKEISMIALLEKSNLTDVLDERMGMGVHSDILHSNTIETVPNAAIGKAPFLKEGHIMISLRKTDLLFMVDPEKEEITWASFGPWKAQHNPQIQDDGSIMLFDNLGALSPNGRSSRILQFDPTTMEILWEYRGTEDKPFYSYHSSSLQVLPNGNVLVTEAVTGRLFEVTRDEEIVWDYWNKERQLVDGIEYIPAVHGGMRYSPADVTFQLQNK